MYLLDTNVLSELLKPAPAAGVVAYLERMPAESQFTTVICEAELRYGLERMESGRRRERLRLGLAELFQDVLQGRVLVFDRLCAGFYGDIRSAREKAGRPISIEDAMIAATARAHSLVVVTRNIRDFENCDLRLADPWACA